MPRCLVKGASLAFSALFLSFYFDAPKGKSWNRTKSQCFYSPMVMRMGMQFHMKYNVNIVSECLAIVKGASLAFSALFLSFHFDAPKEKNWNRTKSQRFYSPMVTRMGVHWYKEFNMYIFSECAVRGAILRMVLCTCA